MTPKELAEEVLVILVAGLFAALVWVLLVRVPFGPAVAGFCAGIWFYRRLEHK